MVISITIGYGDNDSDNGDNDGDNDGDSEDDSCLYITTAK
jgi:hypothetical protein